MDIMNLKWIQALRNITLLFILFYVSPNNPLAMEQDSENISEKFIVASASDNSSIYNANIAVAATGDFVVCWERNHSSGSPNFIDNYDVFARLYSADGQAKGGEFRVNTYTIDNQQNPDVAMGADGKFIISWDSYNQEGALSEIYAQRYNADGNPINSEFRVNSSTSGDEKYSDVSIDENGNAIIVWESRNPVDNSGRIFAQSYNSDGSLSSSEWLVSIGGNIFRNLPSATSKSVEVFTISWIETELHKAPRLFYQSYNSDSTTGSEKVEVATPTDLFSIDAQKIVLTGNGNILVGYTEVRSVGEASRVSAKLYRNDNTEVAEFQFNDDNNRFQETPWLGSDQKGNLLFSWIAAESYDHDRHDLFGQRFNADGTKASEIFRFEKSVESGPDIALNSNGNFTIVWIAKQNGHNRIFAQQFPANFIPAEVGNSSGSGAFGGLFVWIAINFWLLGHNVLLKKITPGNLTKRA